MATVYLAFKDEPSGRSGPFALKVIREELAQSSDFASMFADEAKVSAGMRHPNVVRVEESGVVDGRLFLAMEVLRGHSVWQIWQACRERGLRLRYDLAAWIFARAADGLHHAHEQRGPDGTSLDLVHRDVNQSNLFVTYDGDVKVIDFGLAKAANRVSQTAAGVVKGKLSYLAPEQVTGSKLDRRADVFALGVALWEVTVDRRLFKGRDDIDTLLRVNECRVPDATAIVDDYPARLWAIVSKCLQKDPSDRYPTAQTLATDLDLFVRECGTGIGRDSVAEIMEVLFAKERERTEEWFRKSEVADEPLAHPVLYLVEAHAEAPFHWGELEEWVRLPASPEDLYARAARLREEERAGKEQRINAQNAEATAACHGSVRLLGSVLSSASACAAKASWRVNSSATVRAVSSLSPFAR